MGSCIQRKPDGEIIHYAWSHYENDPVIDYNNEYVEFPLEGMTKQGQYDYLEEYKKRFLVILLI
jgi:hypothetical protein